MMTIRLWFRNLWVRWFDKQADQDFFIYEDEDEK